METVNKHGTELHLYYLALTETCFRNLTLSETNFRESLFFPPLGVLKALENFFPVFTVQTLCMFINSFHLSPIPPTTQGWWS